MTESRSVAPGRGGTRRTDLNIVEGDLEVLRDRTRIVGEDLESVTVADIGGYVTNAMQGATSVGESQRACDRIDDDVTGVVTALSDFSQSVDESITNYATTEDASSVSFTVPAHVYGPLTGNKLRQMWEAER